MGDAESRLRGLAFKLYSQDGKREVEVREFSNGETYLVGRERGEGETFNDRHDGRLVEPFESLEGTERGSAMNYRFDKPKLPTLPTDAERLECQLDLGNISVTPVPELSTAQETRAVASKAFEKLLDKVQSAS